MASALFASRNEPHWGERKVYMRKNPKTATAAAATTTSSSSNPNPRPIAVPSPNHRHHTSADPPNHHLGRSETSPPSEDCSSFNHRPAHFSELNNHRHDCNRQRESGAGGAFVAFNISSYSRSELKELKRRLVSELEQVRNLTGWIESRDLHSATRSAGFSASGSYGGGGGEAREATSSAAAARPPPPPHIRQPPAFDSRSDGLKERPLDVVAGKQKKMPSTLPPSENHKMASGSKRPPPPVVSPREPKRPLVTAEFEKLISSMIKKCGQILTKLMKHKHGWVFNSPVDVVAMGLHDYHQIVKHPMDLGTVKSKLSRNLYLSPVEFSADVRLTFNNALLYNPKGHDVYIMAEQLLRLFDELFSPAHERFEKQRRAIAREQDGERQRSHIPMAELAKRVDPPPVTLPPSPAPVAAPAKAAAVATASTPRPQPPAPLQPQPQPPAAPMGRVVTGKQPKPKAKDPNKREMSFEEKQKLSEGLQSLPGEKMAQVLQIVRRKNPDPMMDDGEIELDFEILNTETLWELDRFVSNCKKMMSKMRRQEALSAAAAAPPISAPAATAFNVEDKVPVAVGETPESAAKKNRRVVGEPGEEDVDIGEAEMPSTHFPPVEIEKDAAGYESSSSDSSSDSSSSSSSTDSDSRSSSDSDTDNDEAQSPSLRRVE